MRRVTNIKVCIHKYKYSNICTSNRSYSRYARKSIITHISVCIREYNYSHNCLYKI